MFTNFTGNGRRSRVVNLSGSARNRNQDSRDTIIARANIERIKREETRKKELSARRIQRFYRARKCIEKEREIVKREWIKKYCSPQFYQLFKQNNNTDTEKNIDIDINITDSKSINNQNESNDMDIDTSSTQEIPTEEKNNNTKYNDDDTYIDRYHIAQFLREFTFFFRSISNNRKKTNETNYYINPIKGSPIDILYKNLILYKDELNHLFNHSLLRRFALELFNIMNFHYPTPKILHLFQLVASNLSPEIVSKCTTILVQKYGKIINVTDLVFLILDYNPVYFLKLLTIPNLFDSVSTHDLSNSLCNFLINLNNSFQFELVNSDSFITQSIKNHNHSLWVISNLIQFYKLNKPNIPLVLLISVITNLLSFISITITDVDSTDMTELDNNDVQQTDSQPIDIQSDLQADLKNNSIFLDNPLKSPYYSPSNFPHPSSLLNRDPLISFVHNRYPLPGCIYSIKPNPEQVSFNKSVSISFNSLRKEIQDTVLYIFSPNFISEALHATSKEPERTRILSALYFSQISQFWPAKRPVIMLHLSLHPTFMLVSFWSFLKQSPLYKSFENNKYTISIASIAAIDAHTSAVIYLLLELYSYWLVIADDTEFFENGTAINNGTNSSNNNNNNSTSNGVNNKFTDSPMYKFTMPITVLIEFIKFFKVLAVTLVWNSPNYDDLTLLQPSRYRYGQFRDLTIRVLRQLYTRDSRRKFLPESFWTMGSIIPIHKMLPQMIAEEERLVAEFEAQQEEEEDTNMEDDTDPSNPNNNSSNSSNNHDDMIPRINRRYEPFLFSNITIPSESLLNITGDNDELLNNLNESNFITTVMRMSRSANLNNSRRNEQGDGNDNNDNNNNNNNEDIENIPGAALLIDSNTRAVLGDQLRDLHPTMIRNIRLTARLTATAPMSDSDDENDSDIDNDNDEGDEEREEEERDEEGEEDDSGEDEDRMDEDERHGNNNFALHITATPRDTFVRSGNGDFLSENAPKDPRIRGELRSLLKLLEYLPFIYTFSERVTVFHGVVFQEKKRIGGDHPAIFGQFGHFGRHSGNIRRERIFEDAFRQFNSLGKAFKQPISVKFFNLHGQEAGVDGGGITKEFLTSLCKKMFTPNSGYFIETSSHLLYPNPYATSKKRLERLEFLGRIIGKCLYEKILVDVPFAPFFLQKWHSKTHMNSVDDLYTLDKDLYIGLMKLKHYSGNVEEDFSLNFSLVDEKTRKVIELRKDGINTPVTNENRLEYIFAVANYKLNIQISKQTDAFLRGLGDLVSMKWLSLFNAYELQMLVGGEAAPINVHDLKKNTLYGEYTERDVTIKYFWEVMNEFDDAHRRLVIKFVTSVSRAPLLGFSELVPKFCIRNSGTDKERLPTSSTCVNLLKLPNYKNKELLKSKLLYAIKAEAGFDLS